jgi:hypothetical protein
MIAMRSFERAAPAFACLTPRDRALLRVLHDLRYLTCPQAHRACYSAMTLRSVRLRLSELRRRGLLAPLRRDAFTDRRTFWGLAPLGRTAAAALADIDGGTPEAARPQPPRAAARAALQLEHLAATNDLFCDACEAGRAGLLPPAYWLAGCRSAIDLDQTSVVPDATLVVAGPDRWWTYYVERDRGTMPLSAMREKTARYRLLLAMADAQAADPAWETRADGWLLFACDDLGRARRIVSLAVDAGLERVWAGPADGCIAGVIGSLRTIARPEAAPPLPAWAAGALPIPAVQSTEVQ